MPTPTNTTSDAIVVPALSLRANLGKFLRRVETEQRSIVIEKRGRPTAVLLNLRDYVKLASPEPDVIKIIGDEARRNKTNAMTARQIEKVIGEARADRKRR